LIDRGCGPSRNLLQERLPDVLVVVARVLPQELKAPRREPGQLVPEKHSFVVRGAAFDSGFEGRNEYVLANTRLEHEHLHVQVKEEKQAMAVLRTIVVRRTQTVENVVPIQVREIPIGVLRVPPEPMIEEVRKCLAVHDVSLRI
jgi:hypothetical protein